ncbi:MAG: hypothetical protein OEV76_10655 [Anaerolineae bacterium]|nr:hypothetical protein [Anaerolineae bacterium]
MKEGKPTDINVAIRDAAVQYAFNRWQSLRPIGLFLLGVTLSMAGSVIDRLARNDGSTWLRLVALAVLASGITCLVIFLLGLGRLVHATRDGCVGEGTPRTDEGIGAAAERTGSPVQKLWRWVLAPVVTWALVFGVMWLLVPSSSHFDSTVVLGLLVDSLVLSAFCLWMVRTLLRLDWQAWVRSYSLSVQRDAGVVVGEFPFRKPKLWVWIAVPGCMALTWLLVWLAPVRFEPLVIAGGFALFGLVKHGQDRRAFGLVLFLSFAPYWAYAAACAAGLHQPFTDPVLRIGIPLFLLMVPAAVVCELYSKGQLRRLQRILKDEGQRARDAGD